MEAKARIVWCYDEARSIVKRTSEWRCKGRVVSSEEAKRIKDERAKYVQRALKRETDPIVPGKRLGGTGTGFFITSDGYVLTNNHVVDKCGAVTVTPVGEDEVIASVRAADPRRDLALLKTDRSSSRPAVFRTSDGLFADEHVTVVGYPLHGKVVIKPVLVSGRIKDGGDARSRNTFAMNIDVRRGNSGGPILDSAGRVMGVVFAKVDTPKVFKKTGKLVRDVGAGLRLSLVRDFLRAHSVSVTSTDEGTPLEDDILLERARGFVAQIGCWR